MTPTQAVENLRSDVRQLETVIARLRFRYDTLTAIGGTQALAGAFPDGSDITAEQFADGVAALARINAAIDADLAKLAALL